MYEELKTLLVNLSEQAKRENATHVSMLIALYRHVFKDDKLSKKELINLTRIPRSTFYDNDLFVFESSDIRMSEKYDKSDIRTPRKENEENERKGFSQTLFIKKEKEEKEKPTTNGRVREGSSLLQSLPQVLADARAQFAASQIPENIPADKVVAEPTAEVVNEEVMNLYWSTYPNRWNMSGGVNYMRFKRAWVAAEQRGWTADAMKEALAGFIADTKANPRMFKPDVFRFLDEEWMRNYLPADKVATMLGEKKASAVDVHVVNESALKAFMSNYPKRKGLKDDGAHDRVRALWAKLEEDGWGDDINHALKEAMVSKRWTEDDGRYIPTVFNFLENEEFRQFLPTGYKPWKKSPAEQKPRTGGIYDLL